MIEISLNPLERLGISREIVRRFCAENGVGLKDLSKLVQTVSRHASTPFHTDVNKTPQAEKIFTDIQQAASELDTEEMLSAAIQSYVGKPSSQIEQLREAYNFKLALLQNEDEKLAEAFKRVIISTMPGSDFFSPTTHKIQRFCVIEPDYTGLLKQDFINFNSVFRNPPDIHLEYSLDNNGNVKEYPLKEYSDCIKKSKLRHYSPKSNELIISLSIPGEPKDEFSEYTENEHSHYFRVGSGQKLNRLKIVGTLFSASIRDSEFNIAFYDIFGLPHSPFLEKEKSDPEEKFKDLVSLKNKRSEESVAHITQELEEGFTFTRFAPLIKHFSFGFECRDILVACDLSKDEPRLLLLGNIRELHEKTPGLYGENSK